MKNIVGLFAVLIASVLMLLISRESGIARDLLVGAGIGYMAWPIYRAVRDL